MRKFFTRYQAFAYFSIISIITLQVSVFSQSDPVILGIEDQVINEGDAFAAIDLDEVVVDPDHNDQDLTWTFYNNDELKVNIEDHIAMIEVPDSDWFGEEKILFTVTDPDSNQSNDEATFTVVPVNDAPLISDIPGQTVPEGSPFSTFDLDLYVTDVDDDPANLTWTVSEGTNLMAAIDASNNSSITINNAGWTGSESFLFTVQDAAGALASDDAEFTVTELESVPVAVDDINYVVEEGNTLSTPAPGVLSNDSDADGDPLSAVLISNPAHSASFNLGSDGSFVYTHDGSNTTSDSFTYVADDSKGQSNVANVSITIQAVNEAPVANPDAYNVNEGANLSVPASGVLSNDTDGDSDPLTAALVNPPSHASSFTLNADGSFSYTHDGSETTEDSFTYRANDGTANSNNATVTITINPQNDTPVAVNDVYTIVEGGTLNRNAANGVLNNDTDAEGNPLTAIKVTDPVNGTLTLNSNGSFIYVHNGSETTIDQFTYRANDGTANSNIATVTITITGDNDPPVAVNDAYSVAEGATLTRNAAGGVLSNDTDPESNPLTAIKVTDPVNGTLTLNANGSFTYVHNGSETTSDQFTYRANDGTANSNIATVTITITGDNDPPVAVNDAYSVAEGATLTRNAAGGVLSNDTDPESNPLTAIKVTDPVNGTLTLNTNGSFTYVHNGSETTSDQFTYRANDGIANSNIATVTITIIGDNDPPVAVNDAYSVAEGATLTRNVAGGVLSNDTDPESNTLTAFKVTDPVNGTLTLNTNGSFTYVHNGSETTSDQFTYRANDGTNNSNIATVAITITVSNDAPALSEPVVTPVSFTEGLGPVQLTSTITVTDEDNPNLASAIVTITSGFQNTQDILTFTPAAGISGNYNSSTGILTFTGSAALLTYQNLLRSIRYNNNSETPDPANRIISFVVNDGSNAGNTITKTVTITPQNDPPVASSLIITALNNRIGDLHTASFTFTDPEGDDPGTHTYQWYRSDFANGNTPVPIAGATAATYIPKKADGGKYIGFEVTPVDEFGGIGLPVRIGIFRYINAAPVASNAQIQAPQSTPGTTISGTYTYSDIDGNPSGTAIYRWYRRNDNTRNYASPGIEIGTQSTYRLVQADANKFIWFKVTPVATTGSSPGDSIWSNIIGPIGQYTASIAGSDTFCHGAVMPITLTITGGKSPYEAVIRRAGNLAGDTTISNITTSPRRIDVKIPGTYTIVSVTDDDGDVADITTATPVVLVIHPRSRALITGSTSLCQGVDTHAPLSINFVSGVQPWSVTIRRNKAAPFYDTTVVGITDDPYFFNARIIGAGPTPHRIVAISDVNGCPGDTTSGSAWLSYKTSPIAVISGSDSICPGETSLLTVTLNSGTPPWSFSYQRNGVNAGTFANITNLSQSFTVTQTGVYTLSVVSDVSGTGCGSGQAIIAGYPPPTAAISGTATICEHTMANLNVSLTGKSPWKFSYHRNFTLDSTTVQNVTVSPRTVQAGKAGTYRLYEVIDRNGCKGTVSGSAVITITQAPNVSISGLKKAYNYEINEIDTIIGTPSGGEYAGPGVIANFFVPRIAGLGTHNITYRYRSSPASCYGYDTAVVNVIESNVLIIFENNRTKYCENDPPFTVTGVNLEDVEGHFTISGGKGLTNNGNNTATIRPGELEPNKYVVTYSYQIGDEFFFENAEFDIGPAPLAKFNWATECFHEGQPVNLNNSSSSSFGFLTDTSYFWKISTNFGYDSDSARNITYTFPEAGIYTIELQIENSYGCMDTVTRNFNLRTTIDLKKMYSESFQNNPLGWQSSSETPINSWKLGNPSKHDNPPRGFSGAFNDTSCWYTKITRIPAPEENSWVTSPCFDFTGTDKPMLSMNIWRLFNSNRDGANIQVTADSGKTWNLVGELGDGENWFNTSYIRGEPGGKDNGWSNYDGTSNDSYWVRARHGLDYLKDKKDVQFRIAYGSDGTPQNNDGIAFDDFTISQRTKMALIEHFTNTGKSEAEKADSIIDLFIENYGMHAIDIQYHTSNPSGDPLFEDNPMIPTSRQFYYGLSEAPYALVDGGSISRHRIDFESELRPFDKNVIIRQSLTNSKFQIRVVATRSGNTLNANVFLLANENLPLMEISVRTVVVESIIEGISGTNGDTTFRNVVRTMLPDAAGITRYKSWTASSEDDDLDYTWEIENVTNIDRLMVVAFVQNEATREIYNVDLDTVELLTPLDHLPAELKAFSVYPNPARQQATVKLNNAANADITLELFNNTGGLVYSSRIPAGDISAYIPVAEIPDGLYVIRLLTKNKLLGISKLIISK